MNCRLCAAPDCRLVCKDAVRDYYRCDVCDLIFVPTTQFVPIDAERERYVLHDNTADHAGYRLFLNEVADVAACSTPPGGCILDFGSGRHAVLTSMLRERAYRCTAYDPLYGIGPDALSRAYDTVILCEVIEHLREVDRELAIITNLVLPGGALVIRTRTHPGLYSFGSWWYKNDCTHINFFGNKTIRRIAERFGYDGTEVGGGEIAVLKRRGILSATYGSECS